MHRNGLLDIGQKASGRNQREKENSGRNEEQIEVRKCLLPFGAESSVSQFAIRNLQEQYIYRTIIFPVVLYGCGTWSLTLREKRKIRVFQNMVLRRIFGPRRDESILFCLRGNGIKFYCGRN